jgi:histone H4
MLGSLLAGIMVRKVVDKPAEQPEEDVQSTGASSPLSEAGTGLAAQDLPSPVAESAPAEEQRVAPASQSKATGGAKKKPKIVIKRGAPGHTTGGGGKGKGKGVGTLAKRHQSRGGPIDKVQGITKPSIRRLARRGGVKRISGLIYDETRGVLKLFLEAVLRDALTYTAHANRKTVTAMDVVYAMKRQGRTLYGFGG